MQSLPLEGFSFAELDQCRWGPHYREYCLKHTQHTPITAPFDVLDIDFNAEEIGQPEMNIRLEVVPKAGGVCNAVLFWFELDMTGDGDGRATTPRDPQT